jgi:hypothetical protein
MKLHTDTLTRQDIRNALQSAKDAGRVDGRVYFCTLDERGSRARKHAYEVQLGWMGDKEPGDGRRWKNSGSSGADSVYAAFYGEWGWFIDELYKLDPELVFGHYKTRDMFDAMTKFAFGD